MKKSSKGFKRVVSLIAATALAATMFCMSAFAEQVQTKILTDSDIRSGEYVKVDDLDGYTIGNTTNVWKDSKGTLYMKATDNVTASDGTTKVQAGSAATLAKSKTASGKGKDVNADRGTKIDGQLDTISDTFNIEANTAAGADILSGLVPVVSTILGVIVIVLSIGMTIFSGCDLCYIAFPVFRDKCETAKQNGTAGVTKKGKDGETKLRIVSDEAQYAVTAAETTQSGKSPFVIYFGKRIFAYVALATLIFILLTGNITVFTRLALRLVSGILKVIDGLAGK